jgi:hypothetical protein
MQSGRFLLTIWRDVLLLSLWSKNKSSKEIIKELAFLFDPEDGGSTFFKNISKIQPDCTVPRL